MKKNILCLFSLVILFIVTSCSGMYEDFKKMTRPGNFKVENYFEAIDSDNYDPALTTSYNVEKSYPAKTEPKEFTGFYFAERKLEKDGTADVVKFYFKRNIINLTFLPEGGKWTSDSSTEARVISGKYGASVSVPTAADIQKDFYALAEWTPLVQATFTEQASYTAVWAMNTAEYTVVYLEQKAVEDLDNDYEDAGSQTFSGVIGQTLTDDKIAKEDKAGFETPAITYNNEGIIKEDGSTIATVKYNRSIITLNLKAEGEFTVSGRFGAAVSVSDPVRTGYTFTSWSPELPATFPAEPEELYTAQWSANTYKVTFNANGGDAGEMSDQTFTYGVPQALNEVAFTKTGYSFNGWAISADSASSYTNKAEYTIGASNVTLYAVWTERSAHNIIYNNINVASGDINSNPSTFKETDTITLNNPSKTGYTFNKWYLGTDNSGDVITGWTPGTYTSDVNVYADWTANTYKVSFNANGGTGSMADQTFTYDIPAALSAVTFSRVGYTFAGWATSATGTKEYNDEAEYSTGASNATLYAVWAEHGAHTINYYNVAGSTNQNVSSFKETDKVTLSNPSKTGYTFVAWYLGTDDSGSTTTGWNAGTYSSDVNIYAKWTANPYKVSFNANGGTGTMSDQTFTYGVEDTLKPLSFSKIGYTFAGWAVSADGTKAYDDESSYTIGAANVTLYALWSENAAHTITYLNTTGATHSNPATYKETQNISLTAASKTGYTFNGWFIGTDASGTKISSWSAGSKTEDLTLYASWTANTYKVSFNANGGTGSMADESFTYDTPKALTPNTFTKTGYSFSGWATSADGAKIYSDQDSYTTGASNVTLYAKWTANSYTVSFDANGGTGSMADQTFTYGTAKNLTANSFTKTGYTFAGWATSDSGSVVYENGASYTLGSASNVTLYAKWNAAVYTVSFNANGGTGSMEEENFSYDTPKALNPNTFTKTGYSFAGWAVTSSGAVTYADKATYTIGSSSVTLYAKWTPNKYTVSFYSNGGTGTMTSVEFTYDEANNLPANTFTKLGNSFAGWATSASGDVVYANKAAYTEAADAKLFAKWTPNTYKVSFNANGGTGSMSDQSFTYGTESNLKTNVFTKTGYTFSGWATSSSGSVSYADKAAYNTGAANTTLYAIWTPDTNTAYTVKHYFQNINDDEYTLDSSKTESLTGTTDTQTSAAAKPETGFTAQTIVQQNIAANGSTEIRVYYDRNIVTLTLDLAGGTGITLPFQGKYGAAVTPSDPVKENFTFNGWSPELPATFPSATPAQTYTAQWKAGISGITITSTTSSDVSISANGNTLTATPPYSGNWTYTWYIDNIAAGSTSSTCTITSTGTHTVLVVASDGSVSYTNTVKITNN